MSRWPAGLAIFVSIGLAASAEAAGSVETLVAQVAERGKALGVAPDALEPSLAAIRAADRKGLPAEVVADKALEGLAKGVPAARLTDAVRDLEARLETAQSIVRTAPLKLGPEQARVAVERVAAQLSTVRDPGALTDVARAAGPDLAAFLSSTQAVTDLVARGAPSGDAGRTVTALVRAGYGAAEVASLGGLLDSYRSEGGRDLVPFFDEVNRRAARRQSLHDLVDPFGDRATPIEHAAPDLRSLDARPGEKETHGQTALEQLWNGRAGEVPRVDTPNQRPQKP